MNRFFYTFFLLLFIPITAIAEVQPSEYISNEKLRHDLDALQMYVHKKLGLNDLDHPSGTPVEKIEADNKIPVQESMYDKGQLSHLHTKLDDQSALVSDLMDRIERLEHQDTIIDKKSEEKGNELNDLKQQVASLQNELDLAVLEIEKLRSTVKNATPQETPDEKKSEDADASDKEAEEKASEEVVEIESPKEQNTEIDLTDKSPEEVYSLAEKYLSAAEYEKAKHIFEHYISMDIKESEKAKAHYYVGEICNLTKNSAAASEHYLQAFQLDASGKHASESLVKLGISLHESGKEKAGCSALSKAKSEYPKMAGSSKSLLNTKFKEFKCTAK
jgi:TolA-binding protein